MKKFMAVYMAPAATIRKIMDQMSKATPAEMKASMDEWTQWANANKAGVVDLGAPLGKTTRISASGSAAASNEMTGYSIVQGDSADAVSKMFKNHPHLKMDGATIELIEVVPVPGM